MEKVVRHKLDRHPDKEEVIRRLSDGDSIRKVVSWLKEKYPHNKRLWLSVPTLQNFRKQNLQLDGKVLKDIQEAAQVQRKAIEVQQQQALLESSNAYQDKINEIAGTHLDVAKKILQLDKIIDNRMEYWYNAIHSGDATPQQADKEMRQYMDRQMLLLQQYKKFVEGMADHTIEHNVNVTVMNEQVGLIREAIRDVLEEFDPDMAMKFMEKLNRKFSELKYVPEISRGVEQKSLHLIEAQILDDKASNELY